ncbi:MAG TPA: hypothetical protein VFJ58_20980 [Armatimonadota bacterium]|nr:hypothetical protein [Armatimonadota bacterium]
MANDMNENPPDDHPFASIPPESLAEFEAAARRPLRLRFRYAFIHTYSPVLMTPASGPSTRCRSTATGGTFPMGSVMPAFEYRQAEEMRDTFARHQVLRTPALKFLDMDY